MARPSQVASSPDEQDAGAQDVEAEDEVTQFTFETDGQLRNLGQNLPDPPSSQGSEESDHNIQHGAPVTKMGAANSAMRPQLNDYESAKRKPAQTPSIGKLKPTSSSRVGTNPAYKNPFGASVTSAQRKLGVTRKGRGSAYELPGDDESPVKSGPPQPQLAGAADGFSPLKKQRKQKKAGESLLAVDEAEKGMNTRSRAKQDQVEDEAEIEVDPFVEANENEDAELLSLIAPHEPEQDEDANAGAPDEGENGDGHEIMEEVEAAESAVTAAPQKSQRGSRGRPKNAPKSTEKPVKQKRTVGRPKQSSTKTAAQKSPNKKTNTMTKETAAAPTEPAEEESATRRSTRFRDAQDDVEVADQDDTPAQSTRSKTIRQEATSATNASPAKSRNQAPQSTKKTRSSRGKGRLSAVENLRQRMGRGSQPGSQEDDGLFVPENGEGAEDEERAYDEFPRSTHRPKALKEVEHVRLSELDLGDAADEPSEHSSPAKSRKRKAATQGARANTGRKMAKFGTQAEQSGQAEADTSADDRRLFGQWQRLEAVFKAVDYIGRNVENRVRGAKNDINQQDADIKATLKLCNKAIRRYDVLKTHSGPVQEGQDPATVLNEINERIEGLRDKNEDFPTDLHNNTKSTEIYFFLIPKLLALVGTAIRCYEAMDVGEATDKQITFGHLSIVATLIDVIIGLEKAARQYTRPPTDMHVVQPVRNLIIPPLREIYDALAYEVQAHEDGQRDVRRREEMHRQRLYREAEEAKRAQEEAQANGFRKKWQKLHQERMLAEGGLMRSAKRAHLQIPDFYHVEVDHNGIQFEREEIFHPRVGPPPDLVDKAARQQWSMVEMSALLDGLKDYTGPNVFERIFRKYCGQGRELNKYSVTEIVVIAALLKERLVQSQRAQYGDVEQWIMDIPVWTRAHHGVGQENEDKGMEVDAEGGAAVEAAAE